MAFADLKNDAVPPDLPPGLHKEALDLGNKSTLSQAQLDAYQRAMDEVEQLREYGEAKWAEGFAEGRRLCVAEGDKSGLIEGKREALLRILARRGLVSTEADRARIAACSDVAVLDRWFDAALLAETMAEVLS